MDFLLNAILGGIVYDLIKDGIKVTATSIEKRNPYIKLTKEGRNLIEEITDGDIIENNVDNENSEFLLAFDSKEKLAESRYHTKFAERLDYILTCINRAGKELTVAGLCELLGYKSENELAVYYTNSKEPDFETIEKIADALGVNKKWLKGTTRTNPFKSEFGVYPNAEGILELSICKEADEIIPVFCISNNEFSNNDLILVCRIGRYKYTYIDRTFAFRSNVGGEGSTTLYNLYNAIHEIDNEQKLSNVSYFVNESKFESLYEGNIYPGVIRQIKSYDEQNIFDYLICAVNRNTKWDIEQWNKVFEHKFPGVREIIVAEKEYRHRSKIQG